MSEVKKGFIRIVSNFTRLGLQLVLGLVLVRIILRHVGEDGWALVALMGAGVGFATMFQEIVRASMVRELGAAYHAGNEPRFLEIYNSAFIVSAAAALAATAMFGVVILLLPAAGIEGSMLETARWFAVAKAVQTIVTIVLAPTHNMYLATERMVLANWLLLMERVVLVLAAVPLYFVDASIETKLLIYAWSTAGLSILLYLAAAAHLMAGDPRLVPHPRRITRGGIHSIVTVGGWNVMVAISDNFHIRLDHWLLSFLMGYSPWSALFGYARIISGYIHQLGTGVAGGVDAVAARMAATGDAASLRKLVVHSTRLHAMVAAPALAAVVLLAQPIIGVWISDRLENPARDLPLAGLLTQVLAIGFAVRAITQGWFRIFYGSGHIHLYAPVLLVTGLANPILSVALYFILPESIRYTCVAWAYSFLIVLGALILAPMRVAPHVGLGARELYQPLVRPSLLALACCPILLAGEAWVTTWNLWNLAIVLGAYGALYGVACMFLVVRPHERKRVVSALARRIRPARAGG